MGEILNQALRFKQSVIVDMVFNLYINIRSHCEQHYQRFFFFFFEVEVNNNRMSILVEGCCCKDKHLMLIEWNAV